MSPPLQEKRGKEKEDMEEEDMEEEYSSFQSGEENLDVLSEEGEEEEEGEEGEVSSSPSFKRESHTTIQNKDIKRKKSRFIDAEANVGNYLDSEEEEDDDEDEDSYVDNEIEEKETKESAAFKKTLASHEAKREEARILAEQRFKEAEENPEAVEERLKALYGERPFDNVDGNRAGGITSVKKAAATISWREAPIPSDPKLFLVKCRPGRERIAVFTACRALFHHQRLKTMTPIPIYSIFSKDSLKGFLYVEAHRSQDVIQGLRSLHMNHMIFASPINQPSQVPLGEGAEVLFSTMMASTMMASSSSSKLSGNSLSRGSLSKKSFFGKGSWVRIRRGKYAGDLALVVDDLFDGSHDQNDTEDYWDSSTLVNIKLIPRLDYTGNANHKGAPLPLQRPFSVEEATKASRISKSYLGKQGNFWIWGGERYSKDGGMIGEPPNGGFLYKEVRIGAIYPLGMEKDSIIGGAGPSGIAAGVDAKPTSQELLLFGFNSADDATIGNIDFEKSSKHQQYKMDEAIIVTKGELKGLCGIIKGTSSTKKEYIEYLIHFPNDESLFGSELQQISSDMIRRNLEVGELVIIGGLPGDNSFSGERGMIVASSASSEDEILVFLLDRNLQHSFHPSLVVRMSNATSNARDNINSTNHKNTKNATLLTKVLSHTLAIYDLVSIDRSATLTKGSLPDVGLVRRIDVEQALVDLIGIDGQLYEGIQMSHITRMSREGSRQFKVNDRVIGPDGRSLLILQIVEDNAFVRSVGISVSSDSSIFILPLSSLKYPVIQGALHNNGSSYLPPSAKSSLGKSVSVGGPGPYKGLIGILRDVGGKNSRIELHTDSKVISVLNERVILPSGERLIASSSFGNANGDPFYRPWAPSSSVSDGISSNLSTSIGSKTPVWGGRIGGQTPLSGSSGNRTPAWGASSITSGSRTPAWGSIGGQTPIGSAAGNRTPAWGSIGGQTPIGGAGGNRTPSWGVPSGSKTPTMTGNRTPVSGTGGNRTPSWGVPSGSKTPTMTSNSGGSRTPVNVSSAGGNRTPSWGVPSGSKTPTMTSNSGGNRTPSWGGTGSKTPTGSTTVSTITTPSIASAIIPILKGVFKYSDQNGKECIGSIKEILPNNQIIINDLNLPQTSLICLVVPEKKDKVILKDDQSVSGTIIGLDGPDAVIRVEGTADFKIVPLSNLVKIA